MNPKKMEKAEVTIARKHDQGGEQLTKLCCLLV